MTFRQRRGRHHAGYRVRLVLRKRGRHVKRVKFEPPF